MANDKAKLLDEVLHISDEFEGAVLINPIIADDVELQAQAMKIADALGELYQAVGAKEIN